MSRGGHGPDAHARARGAPGDGAANDVGRGKLRRAERRIIGLQAALEQSTKRVDKARVRTLLSSGLEGTLDRLASDALREARRLP